LWFDAGTMMIDKGVVVYEMLFFFKGLFWGWGLSIVVGYFGGDLL
jgi:hypothetical protein